MFSYVVLINQAKGAVKWKYKTKKKDLSLSHQLY